MEVVDDDSLPHGAIACRLTAEGPGKPDGSPGAGRTTRKRHSVCVGSVQGRQDQRGETDTLPRSSGSPHPLRSENTSAPR